jgi:hypothetical protein
MMVIVKGQPVCGGGYAQYLWRQNVPCEWWLMVALMSLPAIRDRVRLVVCCCTGAGMTC